MRKPEVQVGNCDSTTKINCKDVLKFLSGAFFVTAGAFHLRQYLTLLRRLMSVFGPLALSDRAGDSRFAMLLCAIGHPY
jgi:hypothetical protein